MKDYLDILYKNFEVKERQGAGGKMFKFVPSEDVIDRMNRTFGGAWCTEVLEREIIENQVLVKVRVWVKDPQSDERYWHEGYASHDIARFTSGAKQGTPVNIGNDVKSATSKAIRTACKHWGVALYLDEEPSDSYVGVTSMPTPKPTQNSFGFSSGPPSAPVGTPTENSPSSGPSGPNSAPIGGPPVGGGGPPVGGGGPPVGFSSGAPIPSGPKPSNPVNNAETMSGFAPPPPVTPQDDGGFVPPTIEDEDAQSVLTDVQKVAIQTIMDHHNLGFADILGKVFGDPNRAASIDTLPYADAVTLIAAGNKLNRS